MVALICKRRTRRRQPPELDVHAHRPERRAGRPLRRDDPRPEASEKPHWRNYIAECATCNRSSADPGVREGIEGQLDMDILAATRQQEAADIAALTEEES